MSPPSHSSIAPSPPSIAGGIEAEINFIAADGRKPALYQVDPPPGRPMLSHDFVGHRVIIADGRPIADTFSIERQGFALASHATAVADLYDEAAMRDVYYPEMEALLKAQTGATEVRIFNHTIRTSRYRDHGSGATRDPVLRAHNDFTRESGPERLRNLPPEEAEARIKTRFGIVNVWRPIVGPLQEFPLAFADARSLAPDDLVPSDLIYPDRIQEVYTIAYNPAQRWFTFPRMRRDEVVLIRTYDSTQTRFGAHSAFADPGCPDPAVFRESIEVRALLFWR